MSLERAVDDAEPDAAAAPWRDPALPVAERVDALVAAMTLEEKLAQLYGVWVGAAGDGEEVAPHQNDMADHVDLDVLLPRGLGQLTRPFGTAPVDAALGAVSLARTQERIVRGSRLGIPAIAHEECLAGFAAWGATAYPVPLSWGASFDQDLVERMARRIGEDLRSVGIHQGLAPVLDVVRDARWGRVEETIGEDPHLVGVIGSAYVRGLESAGVVATLKHFAGYSASRGSRNLAPVSIGPRELADVLLPPFELALREGGARSVMNAYTDLDGVPSAADASLFTGLLREDWGFDGTVVADYFSIGFLHTLHGVAGTWGEAAAAALAAGIDVELPTVKAFGEPLRALVEDGTVGEGLVDRALRRVLAQKVELGLLDPEWSPVPPAIAGLGLEGEGTSGIRPAEGIRGSVDLDSSENRALARELAERAVVLLRNDGALPLAAPGRLAVIGPNAADPYAVLGCYSFPSHVGVRHPEVPLGIELPTLLESLRREFPGSDIVHEPGTSVDGGERDGIPAAVEAARGADVVVLALGDRAGLFGRGTSGEGCDAASLALPGAQQELLDAVLATGTPTVVTLLAGRPYALGAAASEAAAILQTFFPGEEGTRAISGVLSGRVNPSGRLPVSVPASADAPPTSYLAAPLGHRSGVSNIDPTPAFWFGHGLGYSSFEWADLAGDEAVEDELELSLTVTNTGERAGADVVQLYLHDPVASVVRPLRRLVAFSRVELDAGASARVSFRIPADLASFTGRDGRRIVEPGELVLQLGRSAGEIVLEHRATLAGETRGVGHERRLRAEIEVVGD
jgi:beta-xylosidase